MMITKYQTENGNTAREVEIDPIGERLRKVVLTEDAEENYELRFLKIPEGQKKRNWKRDVPDYLSDSDLAVICRLLFRALMEHPNIIELRVLETIFGPEEEEEAKAAEENQR